MKSAFPNRYAGMYNINYGSLAGDPYAEKQAQDKANTFKTLAAFAPAVGMLGGAAIGSTVGDPLSGAQMGGSVGQSVGALGSSAADMGLDDQRRAALRRQALLDAITGMR